MDQVAQQNAALVEQAAAAAASLQEQAGGLVQSVSVFRLDGLDATGLAIVKALGAAGATATVASQKQQVSPAAAAASAAAATSPPDLSPPRPGVAAPRRVAMAGAEGDWAEF